MRAKQIAYQELREWVHSGEMVKEFANAAVADVALLCVEIVLLFIGNLEALKASLQDSTALETLALGKLRHNFFPACI